MSKTCRGSGIRSLPAHGRGTCPICKTDSIKIIYEQDVDGQKVKICKFCKAALKNKAKKAAPAPVAAAPAESASEESASE